MSKIGTTTGYSNFTSHNIIKLFPTLSKAFRNPPIN
uniref:Uncharacterized protein n=1 Tax=Siphoviridae sp. ct2wG4 TaxID=2826278 RepID=A0A8S5QWT2_9CAUD|nr:MAG TPA: hypothetical protein [Siphoviridae sp. ct2wG4]